MEMALDRVQWFLLRILPEIISSSCCLAGYCNEIKYEYDNHNDGSSNIADNNDEGNSNNDDKGGKEKYSRAFQMITSIMAQHFGYRYNDADLAKKSSIPSTSNHHGHPKLWMTMFDLQQIAAMLETKLKEEGGGEEALSLLKSSFLKCNSLSDLTDPKNNDAAAATAATANDNDKFSNDNDEVDVDVDYVDYERRMNNYWIQCIQDNINDTNNSNNDDDDDDKQQQDLSSFLSFYLLLPLRDATREILSCYKCIGNESYPPPATVSATTTSKITPQEIQNYLLYHTKHTLTHIQHFVLPSLLTKSNAQQTQLSSRQQPILMEWEKRYDVAFEEWDDYCIKVLGVECDVLPLFPVRRRCVDGGGDNIDNSGTIGGNEKKVCEEEEEEDDDAILICNYAHQVETCVLKPMRKEFEMLSKGFLKLFVMHGVGDVRNDISDSAMAVKCHGKDIVNAIDYYRQFTTFVSSTRWLDPSHQQKQKQKQQSSHTFGDTAENDDGMVIFSTLSKFISALGPSSTISAQDNDASSTTTYESILSEFINSPIARVNLVTELQQLDAFLSSRKRELSSGNSNSGPLASARGGIAIVEAMDMEWTRECVSRHSGLEGMSLEDVLRFHSAVQHVLVQIVGDGMQAKRLRFLADAIGCCPKTTTYRFRLLCQRAAHLARYMTVCHEQREACSQLVKQAGLELELAKSDVTRMEMRVELIRNGLAEMLG